MNMQRIGERRFRMNTNEIINRLFDLYDGGAEITAVNIKIPSRSSGTFHRSRTPTNRRQAEKKARRHNRKK